MTFAISFIPINIKSRNCMNFYNLSFRYDKIIFAQVNNA